MNQFSDPTPIATVEQFKNALLAMRDTSRNWPKDLAMLRMQYHAPNHMISAAQLAKEFNYRGHSAANGPYGKLAHHIADAMHYKPGPFTDCGTHWWRTLAYWNDDSPKGQDQWIMRPELAQALQEMKWV
jgi:hypothetical protein